MKQKLTTIEKLRRISSRYSDDKSLQLTSDDLDKLASALEEEETKDDEPLNLPYSSLQPPLGIDIWK